MTRDFAQFFPKTSASQPAERPLTPLQALGWLPFFAQQTDIEEIALCPPVRVVEVHRNALHVLGDGLDLTVPMIPDVTVGDWLLLNQEDPQSSRVLARKSLIKRRAAGVERQVQLIAANLDTSFIVTSCNPDFNVARLERYIALAFEAEVTPVIVLTKTDLTTTQDDYVTQAQAISKAVDVVALDARGAEPLTKLAAWCTPGATVAFLGSSGVGKSTLTNALLGSQLIQTQAMRADDAKGRHTTTHRHLHPAPNGCLVLDTPGMRELQMTDAASGIGDLFSDIQELSTQCRFNDCQHETEPHCAVQQAVQAGTLDTARLGRWRKLITEDAFNSASLSERRAKDKAFGKMVRKVVKGKSKRR